MQFQKGIVRVIGEILMIVPLPAHLEAAKDAGDRFRNGLELTKNRGKARTCSPGRFALLPFV